MRFNKTFSNILNITFAYAGRAFVIGLLGLGLSMTACDDDGEEPNTDAGADASIDTKPNTGKDGGGDAKQGDAAGDVAPADTAGDTLLPDATVTIAQ